MRRITKSSKQPDFLKTWKRKYRTKTGNTANYNTFACDHKTYLKLKRTLMAEQYHLCCYCCNRVNEKASHIEHFIPQSVDGSKQLDYHNLHISCNGYIEKISTVDREFCGHRRQDWYDRHYIVSPLEADCERIFLFQADGRIKPYNNDQRAAKMIENFGLDSYALVKAREMAINTAFELIGVFDGTLDEKMIEDYLEFNNNPNRSSELPPFCDAVAYILSHL